MHCLIFCLVSSSLFIALSLLYCVEIYAGHKHVSCCMVCTGFILTKPWAYHTLEFLPKPTLIQPYHLSLFMPSLLMVSCFNIFLFLCLLSGCGFHYMNFCALATSCSVLCISTQFTYTFILFFCPLLCLLLYYPL